MAMSFIIAFFMFCEYTFADPITYDPSNYTFLSVSSSGSSPSINNNGEIVYVDWTISGYDAEIFSTTRGQLTFTNNQIITERWTGTGINDSGEVVYSAQATNGQSYTVYSTIRGENISPPNFQSNSPGINDLGEVSYEHNQTLPRGVFSSTRGMLIDISVPHHTSHQTDISNSGEIVYDYFDINGNLQIFSSTRGQLTTSGGYAAAINNYGDVVYTDKATGDIYLLGGTLLFDVVANHIGLNDYGDIVFSNYVSGDNWNYPSKSSIILATQRPEFYQQFSPVVPSNVVPEPIPIPSAVILGSIGLFFAGWKLRKRKVL